MRSRYVGLLIVGLAAIALQPGCGFGQAATQAAKTQSSNVYLVKGGAYGKGLFIVQPLIDDPKCKVDVNGGEAELDCNSEYVISCDITLPNTRPFCSLVSEIGVDRQSAYPREKRQ